MSHEEQNRNDYRIGRRGFLKLIGLVYGTVSLGSLGLARVFKITKPSKESSMDVEQVDGYDFLSGTLSGRPSAGKPGRLYHTTDGNGTYYDNGSSWVQIDAGP
ncbi:MAG: hypothetical protein ABEK00_01730 [Candidatus Nanohaloarchaea archaeon]